MIKLTTAEWDKIRDDVSDIIVKTLDSWAITGYAVDQTTTDVDEYLQKAVKCDNTRDD
jgi:hypothetical protein